MAETEIARFVCRGCGRSYRAKPELAGKQVKCGCGQVMTAPLPAESHELEDDPDGLYDLAPDPVNKKKRKQSLPESGDTCPSCEAPLIQGAILCVQCGFDLQTKKTLNGETLEEKPPTKPVVKPPPTIPAAQLPYARMPRRNAEPEIEETLGGPVWKEIYIPAALLMLGMFLQWGVSTNWQVAAAPDFLPILGIRVGLNLVLSFVGALALVKLMDLSFGSPGPAILKFAAIALFVPAAAAIVGKWIGYDSAFVAGMSSTLVQTPLGVFLFWWLFGLELTEAFYCVMVIWIVNQWFITFAIALVANS